MGMGECGAKYTTQNKTVWLFKRELEDSSSRLKNFGEDTTNWGSSRSINAPTAQRLSVTILAKGSNEKLTEPMNDC